MAGSHRAASSPGEVLAVHTVPGSLCEPIPGKKEWVHCYACGHDCRIPPGRDGICRVRFNRGGTLMVPWGYVGALQCDPIEKKPFFHVLPGADALSFGMLGCDYHCGYCQNWLTSQTLRDPEALAPLTEVREDGLVEMALERGAQIIASTYNEPLITSEWAMSVFRAARARGLLTAYISNGNGTRRVLDRILTELDLYKVDLKSFRQARYRQLGGVLDRVLETITRLAAEDVWLEVVTLVVPGFNDSTEELREIAGFLASLSLDIPWHVTAFHQDYKMTGTDNTGAGTLRRAVQIGREAGLHFVYAGNLPGLLEGGEDTRCPNCSALIIRRHGYRILENRLLKGHCPDCCAAIPGFWERPLGAQEKDSPRPL